MRRGQITLFLILGLVLVISVTGLYFLTRAYNEDTTAPTIESDVTKTQTCLARTTRSAIEAFADDSVIKEAEGGPATDHEWILFSDEQPLGEYNALGLCDHEGPNGIGKIAGRYYACDPMLYNYFAGQSAQEQLEITIGRKMQDCVETQGQPSVIIQPEGMVVTWSDPDIQHTERIPIMARWRAMERNIRAEAMNPFFIWDNDYWMEGAGWVNITGAHTSMKVETEDGLFATMKNQVRNVTYWNPAAEEFEYDDKFEFTCNRKVCNYSFYDFTDSDSPLVIESVLYGADDVWGAGSYIDNDCYYEYNDTHQGTIDCYPRVERYSSLPYGLGVAVGAGCRAVSIEGYLATNPRQEMDIRMDGVIVPRNEDGNAVDCVDDTFNRPSIGDSSTAFPDRPATLTVTGDSNLAHKQEGRIELEVTLPDDLSPAMFSIISDFSTNENIHGTKGAYLAQAGMPSGIPDPHTGSLHQGDLAVRTQPLTPFTIRYNFRAFGGTEPDTIPISHTLRYEQYEKTVTFIVGVDER